MAARTPIQNLQSLQKRADKGVHALIPNKHSQILVKFGRKSARFCFQSLIEVHKTQEIEDGIIAISGQTLGKFSSEPCRLLLWTTPPSNKFYRGIEESSLTSACFPPVYSEGENSLPSQKGGKVETQNSSLGKNKLLQNGLAVGVSSRTTMIALLTQTRAESVGLCLHELQTLWGKPHSDPIIEGDYICLHGTKEAP